MSTKSRRSPLTNWLSSPGPSAAVEISAEQVTAAAISGRGASRVLTGYATEPLAAGAVEPGLNAPNVHDAAALTRALGVAFEKVGGRPRRVALVLPDSVAKLSLLRFDKVPQKLQDLDQLIRWQMRKAVPFKIEEAQIAWVPGMPLPEGGREFVVTVARRDIIESYEHACQAAGAHAGLVDLASVNLINAVLAGDAPNRGASVPDWLLVHVAADYSTLAVVRGDDLVFFRHRPNEGEDDLAELVHQTAMYHEDRLGGGGFSRVVLAGVSRGGAERADRLRRHLQERIGAPVQPIDFRSAVSLRDRIAAAPELLDTLAPSVGVLLRERVA